MYGCNKCEFQTESLIEACGHEINYLSHYCDKRCLKCYGFVDKDDVCGNCVPSIFSEFNVDDEGNYLAADFPY